MWFLREIFRLIWAIAVAVAIVAVVAAVWALISGSGTSEFRYSPAHAGFVHDFRIGCFIFGALLLVLASAGNRSTASARRMDWGVIAGFSRGLGRLSPPVRSRPGDPTVTPTAVFLGSAIVLFALGAGI
jgi:hypothetical protein